MTGVMERISAIYPTDDRICANVIEEGKDGILVAEVQACGRDVLYIREHETILVPMWVAINLDDLAGSKAIFVKECDVTAVVELDPMTEEQIPF